MMPNQDPMGVYPDQFVVHRDEDLELIDLVADTPGPAGAVETPLGTGISLSVDFVEFDRPLRLTVDSDAPAESIAQAVGSRRSRELTDLLESESDRPLRLESVFTPVAMEQARQGRGSFPGRSSALGRSIGSAAILESIGEDDRFTAVARAVALLEAASLLRRRLESLGDQSGRIDRDVTAAARLLTDEQDALERLAELDRFLALETAKELSRWGRNHPAIRRAADALSSPPEQFREMRGAALRMPAASLYSRRLGFPSPALEPLDEFEAELSTRGLLTVRTRVFESDLWVRVTEAGPMVLLALVPLLDDGDGGIAHAVIGTGYALEDLHIEVSSEPVRPIGNSLAAVAQAVALGREAAMRMAVDARSAHRLWEACAQAWERLGDERRADMARRYAFGGGPNRSPFLAERIENVLDGDD